MSIGVIADVHANLPALEAVLAVLEAADVDTYLCAGDLVGYGPWPNECVERVAALPGVCVAGNHDLIATGRLGDGRCEPLARTTLAWTRNQLGSDARTYLESLPLSARLEEILLTHASPGNAERALTAAGAEEALGSLDPDARVLVVGHTHRPLSVSAGSARLLNPGAVGQSRELRVRARALVLDRTSGEARFLAVPYDTARVRRALAAAGLPRRAYHLPPAPVRRLARRIGLR